jgi:hypothetical protein
MELEGKQNAVAKIIDGEPVDDTDRVAVCVKGYVNGFPARLESFMVGWPFSVSYAIETNLVEAPEKEEVAQAKITILPRIGRGPWSFFAHTFLFEDKGMSVSDKRLEKKMIFNYDRREPALRIIKYPGIPEILATLEEDCKMKEMIIKTDAGIFFNQGVNFESLDLDLCSATFKYMGEIAKVLADIF